MSAAMLALLGAEASMAQAGPAHAREHLERASDLLKRLDEQEALTAFAAMQQHRIAGEAAEASLERPEAEQHFGRALELARALTANRRLARDLPQAWDRLFFGALQRWTWNSAEEQRAQEQINSELAEVTASVTIGLARASRRADDARDAVRLCRERGLPVGTLMLALYEVIGHLPLIEVDSAVSDCINIALGLIPNLGASWALALRASQANAHLQQGDWTRAQAALAAALPSELTNSDGISKALYFGAEVRANLAAGLQEQAYDSLVVFLLVYAEMAQRLSGTARDLPFRVQCESAFLAYIEHAAKVSTAQSKREQRQTFGLALDLLRATSNTLDPYTLQPLLLQGASPHTFLPGPSADTAARAAYDRIGRLLHAVDAKPGVVVLVLQRLHESVLLLCFGGDPTKPLLSVESDRETRAAMASLMRAAERAVLDPEVNRTLGVLGRTAFEALPLELRRRIEIATTVLFVPDFSDGQDRVPIELLHDGRSFLGLSKIVCRCLSLADALRALETPLTTQPRGWRALCVAVARPPGLQALKGTEEELSLVQGALWGWDIEQLSDFEASPDAVLELAPLTNLLHISCHGEASTGAEALVLGNGARMRAIDVATRNRLPGLVYLNACSLARGRYLGGGVSRGMAYAFSRAGAPCVVASLLPIEDFSAARIAQAFYKSLRRETVGEALRRARVESARSGAPPALWGATILIGSPFIRLDLLNRAAEPLADASAKLLQSNKGSARSTRQRRPGARLIAARQQLSRKPTDVRLEAAIAWVEATSASPKGDLRSLALIACEIGHSVGEAQCLLALADELRQAGDMARLQPVLQQAVSVLTPLRGSWEPAWEAHRRLLDELQRLDPTFEARELPVVLGENFTLNDRSQPIVARLLDIQKALDDSDKFWRGELELRMPDHELYDIAWNAVVWGHRYRLFRTFAETDYAAQCAARLIWRGIVPEAACTNLARVLGGVLPFLWGQHRITHLDHSMAQAHTEVLRLLIESVARSWAPPEASPAAPLAHGIEAALGMAVAREAGSKYQRAKAALAGAESLSARIARLEGTITNAIRQASKLGSAEAGELAAWSVGLLSERAIAAEQGAEPRQDEVLALRTLYDRLAPHIEGWLDHYLYEGYRPVRENMGMDKLGRWRHQVL
jgi:hypothetical protein